MSNATIPKQNPLADERTMEVMEVMEAEADRFGGVLPKPEALDPDPETFGRRLTHSLECWQADGIRLVWLEVPIDKAQLVPVAVAAGFTFHHTGDRYLMLTRRLVEDAFIPGHASHYIGAGGVVLTPERDLLVVAERYYRSPGQPPRFKLPGGALHPGEHLADGVVREVREETGVETEFEALLCFRHWHGYRFGKSDIYFICRLRPLTLAITLQEEEIAECRWMPVEEYLADDVVSAFNKRIVQVALSSPGVVPVEVEGYADASRYEFFMPPGEG
ncbi:MAG: NUDIX domain-containing protein [Candidatus Latescibacterota bacterium]|jgi:8-oxo-dGTP pyrophosphatase MutT (NUDIX family)